MTTRATSADVQLRAMNELEFPTFRASFIADWALDLSRVDDLSLEDATLEATRRTDADLVHALVTEGHFLYVITADGRDVGTIWVSVKCGGHANARELHAFLDDITVAEQHRGKGYAPAALRRLEEVLGVLGATRIDLHVLPDNSRAIAVYEKLGYRVTGLKMRKAIAR